MKYGEGTYLGLLITKSYYINFTEVASIVLINDIYLDICLTGGTIASWFLKPNEHYQICPYTEVIRNYFKPITKSEEKFSNKMSYSVRNELIAVLGQNYSEF